VELSDDPTASYAVRAAKPDDKIDPQKVAFSGGRVKWVDIPFRLKDVPLIRGTAPDQVYHKTQSFKLR